MICVDSSFPLRAEDGRSSLPLDCFLSVSKGMESLYVVSNQVRQMCVLWLSLDMAAAFDVVWRRLRVR